MTRAFISTPLAAFTSTTLAVAIVVAASAVDAAGQRARHRRQQMKRSKICARASNSATTSCR